MTAKAVDGDNVSLTTSEGTVIVNNGVEQPITTSVDGKEEIAIYSNEVPTDSKADGDNLVVTTAKGNFTMGGASSTFHVYTADKTYKVAFDRIIDITTTESRTVTLTSGFESTYYGLHYSYFKGVTTVDASKANTETLNLTGHKSEEDLILKGAENAANVITGGTGGDTLKGGSKNDVLKGNSNTDLFVQTAGTDTIVDYTPGDDKISLVSALASGTVEGNDVILTTEDGNKIIVTGANNQSITMSYDGTELTTLFASAEPPVTGVPVDTSVQGSDLLVELAGGNVATFEGATSDTVTIDSGDGEKFTATFDRITNITNTTDKAVTLTSGFEKSYYGMHYSYGKDVTTVDATNANTTSLSLTGFKSEVGLNLKGADEATNTLTGGKGNDTLTGGKHDDLLKGNAGNDKLYGSDGNDSLWGGVGDDIFIYKPNEGTDTIVDYESSDMLQILKADGSSGGTFTDSYFNDNKLTLPIEGGGNVIFNNVGADGNFNINGATYKISGKTLK